MENCYIIKIRKWPIANEIKSNHLKKLIVPYIGIRAIIIISFR